MRVSYITNPVSYQHVRGLYLALSTHLLSIRFSSDLAMTYLMIVAAAMKVWLIILACFNNLSYGQIRFTSVPRTVELGQTYTLQYQPDKFDPSVSLKTLL